MSRIQADRNVTFTLEEIEDAIGKCSAGRKGRKIWLEDLYAELDALANRKAVNALAEDVARRRSTAPGP